MSNYKFAFTPKSEIPKVTKKGYFKHIRSRGDKQIKEFFPLRGYIRKATGYGGADLYLKFIQLTPTKRYAWPDWADKVAYLEDLYLYQSTVRGKRPTYKGMITFLRRNGVRP